MKTHCIYASAIVLSAFILGFFYALAHHYDGVFAGNNGRIVRFSHWTGAVVKPAQAQQPEANVNPRP